MKLPKTSQTSDYQSTENTARKSNSEEEATLLITKITCSVKKMNLKQWEEQSEETVRPLLSAARNKAAPQHSHVRMWRGSVQLWRAVISEIRLSVGGSTKQAVFLLKCCSICFGLKAAFVLPGVYGLIKWSVILMVSLTSYSSFAAFWYWTRTVMHAATLWMLPKILQTGTNTCVCVCMCVLQPA